MVPTNTQKQQELFPDLAVVEKRKSRFFRVFKFSKPIFQQHRVSFSLARETLFIILIAVVLIIAVIFSLGVESGRSLEFPEPMAVTSATQGPVVLPIISAPVISAVENPVITPNKKQEPVKALTAVKPAATTSKNKPFTIQVASYKARNLAEKEMLTLKAKGYSSEIIKKGNYFILCVGAYAKKELAQQAMSDLSRFYKGCYIRKR